MPDADQSPPGERCQEIEQAALRLAAEGSLRRALERCGEGIRRCPRSPGLLQLRGSLRLGRGDLEAALEDFERCLEIEPRSTSALSSRALIRSAQGRDQAALQDISRAVELSPESDAALHNRAVLLGRLGREREAMRDYQHALQLTPNSGGTHNNLAWLLATSADASLRDGARAVRHARRALERGVNGTWLDTLAAALAEAGDLEQAARVQTRAHELSGSKNEAFRRRAEIYQQGYTYAEWRERRDREREG